MPALGNVNWEPQLVEIKRPLDRQTTRATATCSTADTGFLLVGHGTRRAAGQSQFRELYQQFRTYMTPYVCEYAFLELAEPAIPEALGRLASRNCRFVVTVPVLMFAAGHALQDIPTAVQQSAQEKGLQVLAQTAALELEEPVLELSAARFREVVCTPPVAGPLAHAATRYAEDSGPGAGPTPTLSSPNRNQSSVPPAGGHVPPAGGPTTPPVPGTCDTASDTGTGAARSRGAAGAWGNRGGCWDCGQSTCRDVALLIVGRGSSSPAATRRMRDFSRARCQLTRVAWCETAFIHAQLPDVPQGLELLQQAPQPIKVVQPHLLFEGQLMDQLRLQVAQLSKANPHQTWQITGVLGADHQLANCLASLAKRAVSTNQAELTRVKRCVKSGRKPGNI